MALRTSLSGMAVSLTVAAIRSTISRRRTPPTGGPGARDRRHADRQHACRSMIPNALRAIFSFPVTPSIKSGRLLVVGTPIGNLDDLSPRGRQALAEADAIFCEDTRVTAKLAARFGIAGAADLLPRRRAKSPASRSCSSGSGAAKRSRSCPTRECPRSRTRASASSRPPRPRATPSSWCPAPRRRRPRWPCPGCPPCRTLFLGFLPARQGERERLLEDAPGAPRDARLVRVAAPPRRVASIDAARVLGPRRACVARELTKIHEEAAARHAARARGQRSGTRGGSRGEITVVVEGATGERARRRGRRRGRAHPARPWPPGTALKALSQRNRARHAPARPRDLRPGPGALRRVTRARSSASRG